jgi:predicted DNA-binding transcriptional regulator AlpA
MHTSPFILAREVGKIVLIGDLTRTRQEQLGRFPKRIKLGNRKIAYRRSDIDEWARDPDAWRARNAVTAGAEG